MYISTQRNVQLRITARQQQLESFDNYEKDCELATLENDLINDIVVIGPENGCIYLFILYLK